MKSLPSLKEEMIAVGRSLSDRGMLAGSDGNISARLDNGKVLITPSGLPKGKLQPEDLVVVDGDGTPLEGNRRPSSEMAMHLFAYHKRSDINACVHSHAPYATAFAVAGVNLAENILPEVVLFVGGIPMTVYAPPGTEAVPRSLEPFIDKHNAFLLRNHGLLTTGRNLDEAYQRHEIVEHYARIVHLALQLGNVNAVPPDDFERLDKMRRTMEQSRQRN